MSDPIFTCPHCHQQVSAPAGSEGGTVNCPNTNCGRLITVPGVAGLPLAAPVAAPGAVPYGQPPTDPLAIASMVCGIVALPLVCCCYGIITLSLSIAALVMGKAAQKRIRASGGMLGGESFAKAGVILGYVGIAFFAVFIILVICFAASLFAAPDFWNKIINK